MPPQPRLETAAKRPLFAARAPRNSRYACKPTSDQPPQLPKVIKQLQKNGPVICGQERIRSIIASADPGYGERGSQDDLARFLFETGILIADPSVGKQRSVLDSERAQYVFQCCASQTSPEAPKTTPTERIAQILAKAAEPANGNAAANADNAEPAPVSQGSVSDKLRRILSDFDDNSLRTLFDRIPDELEAREKRRREERRTAILAEQTRIDAQQRLAEEAKIAAIAAAEKAESEQQKLAARKQALEDELAQLAPT